MKKVSEALGIVLEFSGKLGSETVSMDAALGRVLAEDIRANRDLPPFDVSAMDGFAVRSADLPGTLLIVEDIKAGDIPKIALEAGQCSRIMTGAALPKGADAVIRVEDAKQISADTVQMDIKTRPGHDVRLRGESMKTGDTVLNTGTEITPGAIGILATVKAKSFRVFRRPTVAILSTGNELESIDDPVDPCKIPDSNSHALMAQVQALGMTPRMLGIARDDPIELERHLRLGLESDVLLVSGGTSVGLHDYVRPTMEKLGIDMKFWRVSMKPGHPLAFGVLERSEGSRTLVFGLPGNPVSSMVCFEQFVAPSMRSMTGNTRPYHRTVTARLGQPIAMKPGRTEFVRVTLASDEQGYLAVPTGTQSSGVLLSMARADGLMVLPAECSGLPAGARVTVQLLDGTAFQDATGYIE